MKEEGKLKSIIIILSYILYCMVIFSGPNPVFIEQDNSVSIILQQNNFHNWTTEDQKLLTLMMQKTVHTSNNTGAFLTLSKVAPEHVLQTYIELLENAGY